MAYQIEPKTVKDFISMDTSLPRFQRKQTWGLVDNFKLCISVFKNYPVGVVIINNDGRNNWLLDGRQRLNALRLMNENPHDVYNWAKKFIGFKPGDDEQTITTLYWQKIEEYLQEDYEDDMYDEKNKGNVVDEVEELEAENEKSVVDNIIQPTFNAHDQREGLKVLLNLILMVHNFKNGKSKFERMFDFRKIIEDLEYYEIIDGKENFIPKKLVELLTKIRSEYKNKDLQINEDAILKYFEDNRYFKKNDDATKAKLKQKIDENLEGILSAIEVIFNVKKILEDSRIGIIMLTSATDLDAQNIFSLVNSGGTKLTAEELLSAKPYWNIIVKNPSNKAVQEIKSLYERLKVVKQENVVRWDLCATLIGRIDKRHLIFKAPEKDEDYSTLTTLGFKLISAIYIEGISSINVSEIERSNNVLDWNSEYEQFIDDINTLCDILYEIPYFKCMLDWNASVMSITSNTIALEFLTILYKEWIKLDKVRVPGTNLRKFNREAVMLFDKLIYEYSTKQWRGSSDSKLANDIKKIETRFEKISEEDWTKLIDEMLNGKANNQDVNQKIITPVLYHSKFIANEFTSNSNEKIFEIDHIYPQSLFNSNDEIQKVMMDSLTNLQILSKASNEDKKAKKLSEIMDHSIISEIKKSSGIELEEYVKFSDIRNINELKEKRRKYFEEIYKSKRNTLLDN